MKTLLQSYHPISLLEVPRIHTSLLWDLVLLFGIITAVYFLLIFWLRNRISSKSTAVSLQKKELAPMISTFLFYQEEADQKDTEEYIRMKIDIRDRLKDKLNRKVMTEVLMDLTHDVSGLAQKRVFALYQELGLDRDAFNKLKSWRWEKISRGIMELTEMKVDRAYPFIRGFINDRRKVIRQQAQIASVTLRSEGIVYFLDTARYRISEWQQLKLLEILRNREDFEPPRFKAWLTSENRDVVLFALRLIRHYRQNDAEEAIVTLLRHRKDTVKMAAIDCIREFRFKGARPVLIRMFSTAGEELKIQILNALSDLAIRSDLNFLQGIAEHEASFLVRSKARAVLNAVEPGSALPETNLQELPTAPYDLEATAEKTDSRAALDSEPDRSARPEKEDNSISIEAKKDAGAEISETTERAEGAEPAETTETHRSDNELAPTSPTYSDDSWDPIGPIGEDGEITEEELAIFEACLWQELDSILNEYHETTQIYPDRSTFLPVVVVKQSEGQRTVPEWLIDIDVLAEEVQPWDADPVALPNPVSGLVLDFEWDGIVEYTDSETTDSRADYDPDLAKSGTFEPDTHPDAPLEVLHWPLEDDFYGEPDPDTAIATCGKVQKRSERFSIFGELFEHYDTESKLLLMDQLVAVGDEKELQLIMELTRDPDPKIREKAGEVAKALKARLEARQNRQTDG